MTVRRSKLVDPNVTPWYHCISLCARDEPLLARSKEFDPKPWIENRLEQLVGIFAVDVGGFAVMDTHLHVLTHLNVKATRKWSKEEVLRRWAKLYPPRGARRNLLKNLKPWIKQKLSDHKFINTCRKRLVNLGWFMKSLKEPLAHRVNKAVGGRGTMWAGRYKSIAILDESALLATSIYIDLNPFAANLVSRPEEAVYTSLYLRVAACRSKGRWKDLKAARKGTVLGVKQARGLESGLWLCPIEDRRAQGACQVGLLEGFSLGSYLLLLDETSRLARPGKASLGRKAEEILDRIGTTASIWQQTLIQLFSAPKLVGVAFAMDRRKLREAAKARGVHHLANLNGCPAKPDRPDKSAN